MACYITYGPISLEGVVLKSMKCDTIMSDDKLTVRYKRWTIQFAAHCNTNMNRHLMVDRIANPANVQKGGSGLGIDTAEAVLFWLSQPRQFFRLEYDGETIIGFTPGVGRAMDSNFGPFTSGMQVTNVTGNLGYKDLDGISGSYFMVSGTFEISVDGGDSITPIKAIQGYSMGRDHDVDGDSLLTVITTSIVIYGRPEVVRSLEGGGGQSVWANFPELGVLLSQVPAGFKRHRAKIQVLPNATEARILFIDKEEQLPLGSRSPATLFEPSQTDFARIDNKGAGAGCMTIININATCPKNGVRERVINQMLWWVAIKGQGGMNGRGINGPGPDAAKRFVMYREIILAVNYAQNTLQLTAKIEKVITRNGVGGMPFSVAGNGYAATEDYGKVDRAMVDGRDDGQGEAKQGTQREAALSRALNYHGTAGSYLAEILIDRIKKFDPQRNRVQPDGSAFFCPAPAANEIASSSKDADFIGGDIFTNYVYAEVVPAFTLPDIAMTWTQPDGISYESSWMQTKYDTNKGTMVLPTGGFMPGGTGDPTDIPKRVRVTVHEGEQKKVVTWGIQCKSQFPPYYPATDTGNSNDILTKSVIKPASPNPMGNGLMAWTITGTYYYDCLELKQPGDTLGVGVLPITPGSPSEYVYSSGKATPGRLPQE